MDLYRYFHPHHNPRLRKTPLRLQELGELEQAALEMRNALKRAQVRTNNANCELLDPEEFDYPIQAIEFLVDALHAMTNQHPGDSTETMAELLEERRCAPGWENWSRLLAQRLRLTEPDTPQIA